MINYNYDLEQGSDEWLAARCGILTASEMKLIITPANLKPAKNDKCRAHVYELLSQRISQYVEPCYIGDDMLRGMYDEGEALEIYDREYAETKVCGFVTNDEWGFKIGYSPDGLVGEDGLVEVKSRRQKYQVQVIIDNEVPKEHLIQVQTGLLVTGRKWCDYISYSAGLPMAVIRVEADEEIQSAIIEAAAKFYLDIESNHVAFTSRILAHGAKYIKTERKVEEEITV